MAYSHVDSFLREATYFDTPSETTLNHDQLYGLYTSWCSVAQQPPVREAVFWKSLHGRITRHSGLRMKGPAAADYILCSYPDLV